MIKCNKGQGLIEYLILVALIAVGTLGAVRLLQQSIGAQYATVITAIQGDEQKRFKAAPVSKAITSQKDLSNFMKGAVKKKSQRFKNE